MTAGKHKRDPMGERNNLKKVASEEWEGGEHGIGKRWGRVSEYV